MLLAVYKRMTIFLSLVDYHVNTSITSLPYMDLYNSGLRACAKYLWLLYILLYLQHRQWLSGQNNVFEIVLSNSVTKLVPVPKSGTVRDAIAPLLTRQKFSFETVDIKSAASLQVFTQLDLMIWCMLLLVRQQ